MRFRFNHSERNSGNSLAGKLGASLFFAAFLGLGLLFLGLLGMTFVQTVQPYFWPTASAEILSSKIKPDGDDYRVEVHYRYSWNGNTFESDTFTQPKKSFSHYDSAAKALGGLTTGAKASCRVNPKDPSIAVLHLSDLWIGLFVVIPLAFVAVGGFGIWGSWAPDSKAVSPAVSRSMTKAHWLFGAIFTLVGLGTFIAWSLPMWTTAASSSRWIETPCVIISSRVKSHPGDDTPTYSVAISYRYTFGATEYRSDRFNVVGGSSSGSAGKKEIVSHYPQGSTQICYVNPAQPSEALLQRGFSWGLLFGLLPLVFMGVGVAMLFYRPGAMTRALTTSLPAASMPETGELRASTSPWIRLGGTIGAALFWNGIVAVFLVELVGDFRRGHPDWVLALFLTPFVLVGLGLTFAIGYFALALGNPRIQIRLENESPLEPGGTLKLGWKMDGATRRLERLVIYLEGREEATYRRGTSSTTDRSIFFRQPIADITGSWMDFQEGPGSLTIPADVMPTFRAPNNRILWHCRVWGKIPRWPDVNEEFEITLNPPSNPG